MQQQQVFKSFRDAKYTMKRECVDWEKVKAEERKKQEELDKAWKEHTQHDQT